MSYSKVPIYNINSKFCAEREGKKGRRRIGEGMLTEDELIEECAICNEVPLRAGSDVGELFEKRHGMRLKVCSHVFCFECIEKWAWTENSCPLCRRRFTHIRGYGRLHYTPDKKQTEYPHLAPERIFPRYHVSGGARLHPINIADDDDDVGTVVVPPIDLTDDDEDIDIDGDDDDEYVDIDDGIDDDDVFIVPRGWHPHDVIVIDDDDE